MEPLVQDSSATLAPATRTACGHVTAQLGPRRVRVQLDQAGVVEAEPAVLGWDEPAPGDRVLVTRDDNDHFYVVGVLARAAPATPSLDALLVAPEHDAPEPDVAAERVRVHDRRGRLIFEYDPVEDRATLHAPSGDLRIEAAEGRLELSARDGIEVKSEAEVVVGSSSRVVVEAERGERATRVQLTPDGGTFVGAALTAAADGARLVARELGVDARRIQLSAHRVERIVGVLDTRAERIVERVRDSFREVERVSQTRAGTLRLVARKAASLLGENTLIKARAKVKVKGERIHLA